MESNKPSDSIDEMFAQLYLSAWYDGNDDTMEDMSSWIGEAKQTIAHQLKLAELRGRIDGFSKLEGFITHAQKVSVHRGLLDEYRRVGAELQAELKALEDDGQTD